MLRYRTSCGLLFLLLLLSGCNRGPKAPPANYASFEPAPGQWVIEAQGIDPAQVEKIRTALEELSGVEKGTVLVNADGQYVAFETSVSTSDAKAHGDVKDAAIAKLEELGVDAGEQKTSL